MDSIFFLSNNELTIISTYIYLIIGKLEICKYLISKIDDKNPSDDNGWTPLHDAALEGSERICRLIMNKVENKRPLNTGGETPEDVAFGQGFRNIVELFYTHKEWQDKMVANAIKKMCPEYYEQNPDVNMIDLKPLSCGEERNDLFSF